jgi:excinuclease ABC subunit A
MNMNEEEQLEIIGARVHNLKNIDVVIPRNKLVVITGLSGSGKSSLAFDTIFAEGQRRYIESFSIYARQFLGNLERPDVDRITGLSPVISIEQKTTNKNPRSTVGTITEIYDFLRLLYARAATAFSYTTGKPMVKYTDEQIINIILEKYNDKKISILAPVVKGRKGHYRELFEQIIKQGFIRARIDGEITELKARMQLDRYKIHNIEIVIDRFTINEEIRTRLNSSLQLGMRLAKGAVAILDNDSNELSFYSRALMCADSGISYDDPAPNLFSFNSPFGACQKCNGLGVISQIDQKKLIPNSKLSIKKGGILALGEARNSWIFEQINALGAQHGFNLDTPIEDIPEEVMDIILYGSNELVRVKNHHSGGTHSVQFEGIVNFIARQQEELGSKSIEKWAESFMNKVVCPKCLGARLKQESLYYKIDSKNIFELSTMNLRNLKTWFEDLELTDER